MTETTTFSAALRERSSSSHSESETSGFMANLLKGESTREDYVALVIQHYFIYQALEAAAEKMRNDPLAAAFVDDALTRMPALERDLEFLVGADWREQITPLPVTQRYVDRINEVGENWPGGFVAHHYTRYLGDLSGGIYIGRVMARRFGFEDRGVEFYNFSEIESPTDYKNTYRDLLDSAAWDATEQARVIDEVLEAYRYNTELFEELDRARLSV
jgi:heme oxygenase